MDEYLLEVLDSQLDFHSAMFNMKTLLRRHTRPALDPSQELKRTLEEYLISDLTRIVLEYHDSLPVTCIPHAFSIRSHLWIVDSDPAFHFYAFQQGRRDPLFRGGPLFRATRLDLIRIDEALEPEPWMMDPYDKAEMYQGWFENKQSVMIQDAAGDRKYRKQEMRAKRIYFCSKTGSHCGMIRFWKREGFRSPTLFITRTDRMSTWMWELDLPLPKHRTVRALALDWSDEQQMGVVGVVDSKYEIHVLYFFPDRLGHTKPRIHSMILPAESIPDRSEADNVLLDLSLKWGMSIVSLSSHTRFFGGQLFILDLASLT